MSKRNVPAKLVTRIIVTVSVCFALVLYINQFSRIRSFDKQIKELDGQISEQEKINTELSDKYDVYSSKEYVEKIARDELGLMRANEKIYIDSNQR